MRNNTTLLLTVFLVMSAVVGGGLSQVGTTPQGTTSNGKERTANAVSDPFRFPACDVDDESDPEELCAKCPLFCPARGLLDTIESNFSEPSANLSRSRSEEPVWGVPRSEIRNVDFMIATLPDPTHTHLGLTFDRIIEAIQKGAQASGQNYLFSRAWMPWESETKEESSDFRLREESQFLQDKKEDLPGLLIFRQEPIPQKVSAESKRTLRPGGEKTAVAGTTACNTGSRFLFVLVVGETPTGGVRRTQFQTALKIIHVVNQNQPRDACYPKPSDLRILGTTFSGSLDSLEQLLFSSDLSEFSHLDVESGTATDARSIDRFREDLSHLKGANGRFITMQQSGDYSAARLKNYLSDRGYQESEIASLSEDETALGRNFGRSNPDSDQLSPAPAPSSNLLSPKLYFPRDIAQLRASYQKEMRDQTKSADNKQAPRSSLPLNLDVTGSDDDSVPTYAPLQTPLSQESVMKGIVANLRKHHAKVVIVNATNVLDALFLCQYLRAAYPEGRLVVFGADLLFQQDPNDSKLDGVLAVTIYPLVPGIDDAIGHPADHVDQVMSDSFSVGVFNAMVSSLAGAPWGDKNVGKLLLPPPQGGDYASYGWPQLVDRPDMSNFGQPALWLVEVGKGGYWPIALLDDPSVRDKLPMPASQLSRRADPPSIPFDREKAPFQINYGLAWRVMWWVFAVFLWSYLYLLAVPPPWPRSELGVTFSLPGERTGNGFLFVVGLLLLGVQVCFLYPWMYRLSPLEDWGWLWWILPLASVAGLIASSYRGFACRQGTGLGWVLVGFAGAVLLVSATFLLFGMGVPAGSAALFFARRFTHLESGISPATPVFLLLAGFLWCCWYGMDGVQINRPGVKLLPADKLFSEEEIPDLRDRYKLLVLTQEANQRLFDILHPFCSQIWAYVPAGFAVLTMFFLLGGNSPVEVVEVPGYRTTISLLLGLAASLMVFLCTRVILVWLECKDLLRRLENVKLRRSFGLQKDFRWGTLWRMASDAGVISFYQRVNREMECLDDFLKFEQQYYDRVIHEESETRQRTDASEAQGLYYRVVGRIYGVKEGLRILIAKFAGEKPKTLADRMAKAQEVNDLNLQFQSQLSEAIGRILLLLTKEWALEPTACGDGENNASENSDEDGKEKAAKIGGQPKEKPSNRPEVVCAERCACLYFLNLILIVLRRIRSLVFAISGLFVFIVLTLSSYPFEPYLQLRTGAIVLFLGALACIGYVYGQIYRNKILSRVTSTSEDQLGWDFWVRMTGFVAVPVLSLLAAQFPALNRFLFSWVQPALESFH
jgi:hypothetical protein